MTAYIGTLAQNEKPHGSDTRPSTITSDISGSDLASLDDPGTSRILMRGEVFESVGRYYEFGILQSGVIRINMTSADGREFILDLLFPGQVLVCWSHFIEQMPVDVTIEAVEDCSLLVWSSNGHISRQIRLGWKILQKRLTEKALIRNNRHLVSFLTKTALERYRDLDNEFPVAWRSLPQHLIASYLGVTPQYFCRLKRMGDNSGRALKNLEPLN